MERAHLAFATSWTARWGALGKYAHATSIQVGSAAQYSCRWRDVASPAVARRPSCRQRVSLGQRSRRCHVNSRRYAGAARTVASIRPEDITVEQVGVEGTLSYRVYLRVAAGDRLRRVSPWHELPLFPHADEQTLLFVNEIPKGTRAKMEIAKEEPLNPIKQDTKKGELRFYEYGPSLINYGALPQTWEDPAIVHKDTGCSGDNDPLDVIEIGSQMMPTGAVYEVKPLGMLGLIDDGELDWKLIAIRKQDPKASLVHNLSDMEEHFPNLLHEVREWFRLYKTAEGKGENTYAYHGKALDEKFALQIVRDAHENWRKLKSGERANDEHLALT